MAPLDYSSEDAISSPEFCELCSDFNTKLAVSFVTFLTPSRRRLLIAVKSLLNACPSSTAVAVAECSLRRKTQKLVSAVAQGSLQYIIVSGEDV